MVDNLYFGYLWTSSSNRIQSIIRLNMWLHAHLLRVRTIILRFLRYADLNHLPCSGEPASEFPRRKWVHGSLFVPIVGYWSTKLMVSAFGMFSHVSDPCMLQVMQRIPSGIYVMTSLYGKSVSCEPFCSRGGQVSGHIYDIQIHIHTITSYNWVVWMGLIHHEVSLGHFAAIVSK